MPERVLAATAGASLADVLVGPPRDARVLAVFPTAVYVLPERARALAVVSREGTVLPNALVVDDPAVRRLPEVPTEAPVRVGGGRLSAGPLQVRADRWVDRRYRPGAIDPAGLTERLVELERLLRAGAPPFEEPLATRVAALGDALAPPHPERPAAAAHAAARALLGLGEGLTPSGDDVLAGAIAAGRILAGALGLASLDRSLHDLGGALLADAGVRTTALSAALLWHAARGEPAEPARHVLRALADETPLEPALRALLRVGHTSGRDLAEGIAIGARTALAAAGTGHDHRPSDRTART